MAIVDLSSGLVTNFNSIPRKMNKGLYSQGRLRRYSDTIEIGASDSIGSIYRLVPVHSSVSIHQLLLSNDAISGGTDFDLGLYLPTREGGTLVDVNSYGDALDLSSALQQTDVTFEVRDLAVVNQQVWQDAGQATDPARIYEIALTAVTIGGGGTVTLSVLYTDGS